MKSIKGITETVGTHINPGARQKSNRPNWTNEHWKQLEHRPLLKTHTTPGEIFCEILGISNSEAMLHMHPTYEAIAGHLSTHYRESNNWDEYAKKIPDEIRDKLKTLIVELRRCGYLIAGVRFDGKNRKIVYAQMSDVERTKPLNPTLEADMCSLCQRECPRRDFNGVLRRGVSPCWEDAQ